MDPLEATALPPTPTTINDLGEAELWTHRALVLEAFHACRTRTLNLSKPLSVEDMMVQSMPDTSPTKWHLAHTTWFFETFILEQHESGFRWFDDSFQVLFNSYYNGIGKQHPRPRRGMISRPDLQRVLEYRLAVDERVTRLLNQIEDSVTGTKVASLVRLGVNHEQQHQELVITDIKHALSQNPAWPAYDASAADLSQTSATTGNPARSQTRSAADAGPGAKEPDWLNIDGGAQRIGFQGDGFCFDNETPVHEVLLQPFQVAKRPVTNADWLAFMKDGGYENPLLWLDEGWAWRRQSAVQHPLYWQKSGGTWTQYTLAGRQPIRGDLPVSHVSFYEADAFARWAGARLPTEAEWETATSVLGSEGWEPAGDPVGREFHRNWEWTGSAYLAYPGFRAAEGAVGEYNGKFMVNQMVLRGRSAATAPGHARISYRNFFPAAARWQYSGLRLARNIQPA